MGMVSVTNAPKVGLVHCTTQPFRAAVAALLLPAFILALKTKSSTGFGSFSLPTAWMCSITKQPSWAGRSSLCMKQDRAQREGREKEGLNSFTVPWLLSPQKMRTENRSDARQLYRKSQVTETPLVHPCTCALEVNTTPNTGRLEKTASFTASTVERWRPYPPWKSPFRRTVYQVPEGKSIH